MKILPFPNLRQTHSYDCGAKAAQSVLAYYGTDVPEKEIMSLAGTNKNGTFIKGIRKVFKKYGLKTKIGKMTASSIKRHIDKRTPVIVLLQAWTDKENVNWEENWEDGHYAVVIGYNSTKLFFEDPSSVARVYLTLEEFEKRWHDKGVSGKKYINYGIAVYGKRRRYDPKQAVHMD